MIRKSKDQEDGKGGGENRHSLLSLLWRVMIFLPNFNLTSSKRVRYIFVSFDVWEYIGCDYTWAGLVTTLLDEIEKNNKCLFSFFRVFGNNFSKMCSRKERWVCKRQIKITLWITLCVVISFPLCIVPLHIFVGSNFWPFLGYTACGVAGLIGLFPIRTFGMVTTNYIRPLSKKLLKAMSRTDFSAQLGFMQSVKEDIKTTINFLHFLKLKEDREIRVVLKITNLDRCSPDKVVQVLDAMNILLCDRNAPFISILAADSNILVECIKISSNSCSNGYMYLDRIVSLTFCLPQMSQAAKLKLLKEFEPKDSTTDKDIPDKSGGNYKGRLLTKQEKNTIHTFLGKRRYEPCFPGNSVQMKRVVNTALTMFTMIKMGFQLKGEDKMNGKNKDQIIEQMIDWILLANCWPAHLSWILQCMEQSKESEKLLEVYDANHLKPENMQDNIKKLFELDGGSKFFREFLNSKNFFTVECAKYFTDLLINMDFSFKRQFELLHSFNSITGENKNKDISPPAEDNALLPSLIKDLNGVSHL